MMRIAFRISISPRALALIALLGTTLVFAIVA
jgi:hypothetical protein